jgi:hypothetical protein
LYALCFDEVIPSEDAGRLSFFLCYFCLVRGRALPLLRARAAVHRGVVSARLRDAGQPPLSFSQPNSTPTSSRRRSSSARSFGHSGRGQRRSRGVTLLLRSRELSEGVLLARVGKLPELGEHRVDVLKRLVDVLALLPTREDDLAGDEDQQHNLGQLHAIDQPGEELGLVLREVTVGPRETLQANGELDVARADHVLDLKLLRTDRGARKTRDGSETTRETDECARRSKEDIRDRR